ncbi:MAG: thiamine diphosphokinase [Promethearchaeia archaeon]|nr:MAG: thiamine diphosphokinase [Candidatus Lokiarchaeia archaeon]
MTPSTSKKKIALLVAGSPEFDKKIIEHLPLSFTKKTFTIAIDKGLEFLDENQIVPDLILGDFDSVNPDLLKKYEKTNTLSYSSHKDQSDTEIAVNYALNHNYNQIFIINAIGGRLDHDLFNRLILLKAPGKIWLVSSKGCMSALLPQTQYSFPLKTSTVFSLIPLTKCKGVTITGCEYPLINQEINPSTLTLSNISVTSLSVIFTEGSLLFFVEKTEGSFSFLLKNPANYQPPQPLNT